MSYRKEVTQFGQAPLPSMTMNQHLIIFHYKMSPEAGTTHLTREGVRMNVTYLSIFKYYMVVLDTDNPALAGGSTVIR